MRAMWKPLAGKSQRSLRTQLKNSRMENIQRVKELKSAAELEAMILEDLRKVAGCPEKGVNVTVYGTIH